MRKLKRNKIKGVIRSTEKLFMQSLFSCIDSCVEKCVEVEYLLNKREVTKKAASCISLCRDFTDLGPMLSIVVLRRSPFATQIAQVLHEIITKLSGLLIQLNQPCHEIIKCGEMLKMSATKIDFYCNTENISRK